MPPDLDALIAPVSAADPCGANLEYSDPSFAELDRAALGKAEQQIGSTVIPAEEPDWKTIGRLATGLLARTKDLRVAVHLTKALLHSEGLRGFADGLTLVARLIESYWDGVYPRLDPEDSNDPTMRVNILATLTEPGVLAAVRVTPLIASRTIGRFSLKDVEAASGESSSGGNGTGHSAGATIDAAGMDCDLASLQENVSASLACAAALKSLDSMLTERVGAGSAPSFGELSRLVRKIVDFLQPILVKRVPAAAAAFADAGGAEASPVVTPRGEIASREDVVRALDRISEYYRKNEPSSPIPLFMERCKRLVMMGFVDIVRELVPDAVSQVELLKGRTQ